MEAAIKGVLLKLDPYSNYINPDELDKFRSNVDSQFGGIGIQVGMENGQLKIISPIVGSPAYREGLQAGDVITEIEGKSTDNITLDGAVTQLKGESGTSVTIKVRSPDNKEREVKLTREIVQVDTVLGDLRKEDDSWEFLIDKENKIGYIRITAFSRETTEALEIALEELKEQGMKGLILDLRFDPGGLLTAAIEIADLFISEGRIVSTKGRNTEERSWDAHKAGTYEGFPMAVLVNRYSASASEILSACLQDHKRAVIIGERTWGKGSVQNVIELEGGRSALKLTTASYWRPSGKNILRTEGSKEWGVDPNPGLEVKVDGDELRKLVAFRRDRDIVQRHVEKPETKDKPKTSAQTPDSEKKPSTDQSSAADPPKTDDAEKRKADQPDVKPADPKKAVEEVKEESKEEEPVVEKDYVDRQLEKALEYLRKEIANSKKS